METSTALEKLYKIIEGIKGKIEAKNFVSSIVFNAIDDLQQAGIPVTAENLERLIVEKAHDFIEASKNAA